MQTLFPTRPKPVVLAILDGWGHNDAPENNAIGQADTPCYDHLLARYPHTLINASEGFVGLPAGQMGNSEVGHMNIGAGRVVMQDLPRIDHAIASGELAKNPALIEFIAALKQRGGACHLMGLLSPGGVHSHQSHLAALANIISDSGVRVHIHAFLDGRDTSPKSALDYLATFQNALIHPDQATIATISGRYYVMDRDKRWERVSEAYDAITGSGGRRFTDGREYISAGYAEGKTDEFILPACAEHYTGMDDEDGLLMGNFRADRAREILTALLDPNFNGFERKCNVVFTAALGMVEYSTALNAWMQTLFAPEAITDILGEVVSKAGLKQLRIAETEKYAHVTFFFNAGREAVFDGEERILVPSPKVATYDLKPEMSAPEVTDKLVEAIEGERFDLIVVNYANTDMVGHSGNLQAAKQAVEAVDKCLQRLSDAVLAAGGAMLITADHGNAEMMYDPATTQAHTAHTLNLVPAILVAEPLAGRALSGEPGKLADIAPTMLDLLQLPKPAAMTGQSLLAALTT